MFKKEKTSFAKKVLHTCIIVFGLFFISLTVALVWLRSVQKPWVAPYTGSASLTPSRGILKEEDIPEDSAHRYLLKVAQIMDKIDLDKFYDEEQERLEKEGWKPEAYPELDRILVEAEGAFELIKLANESKHSQIPTATSFNNFSTPYLSSAGSSTTLLVCRSKVHLFYGGMDAALSVSNQAFLLGSHLSRGGNLICALVGIGCKDLVMESLKKILCQKDLTVSQFKSLTQNLNQWESEFEPLGEVFRYEYLFAEKFLKLSYSGEEGSSALVGLPDWTSILIKPLGSIFGSTYENTQDNFKNLYKRIIDEANKKVTLKGAKPAPSVPLYLSLSRPPTLSWSLLQYEDPIGFILSDSIQLVFETATTKHYTALTNLRLLKLFTAIKFYELKNSKSPSSLQNLIPEFLDKIPTDPFSGKPLLYRSIRKGEWAVYSVGDNGVDDGGISKRDFPVAGDLDFVFKNILEPTPDKDR